MTVDTVRNDLAGALGGAAPGGAAMREVQDRFLKLLVTQLRHQDPMNPLDNAQLTLQLAQMSTVEGINRLNAGLETLLASYRASQTLQAAGLIGRQVLVEGDGIWVTDAGMAMGGLELEGPADRVEVHILDAAGVPVRTLDLGGLPAGLTRFVWDGLDARGEAVPPGPYRFTIAAEQGGRPVTATAMTLDEVLSVLNEGAAMSLELAHKGRLSLDQVRQIL